MGKITIVVDEKQEASKVTFLGIILDSAQKRLLDEKTRSIGREFSDLKFHASQDKRKCPPGFKAFSNMLNELHQNDLFKERILERDRSLKLCRGRFLASLSRRVAAEQNASCDITCLFDQFSESRAEKELLKGIKSANPRFNWKKIPKNVTEAKLVGVVDYILYLNLGIGRRRRKK